MSKGREVGGSRDLIDVTTLAHELGFPVPARVDMEVWQATVELGGGPTLELARLWDVLKAAKSALERTAPVEPAHFNLMVVCKRRARFVTMEACYEQGVLTVTMGERVGDPTNSQH